MKKFYSLIIFLLIIMSASGQQREWNGGNGVWNDASKWTPMGTPTASDVVVFNGSSATISNVPGLSFKGMVVNGGNIILNGVANEVNSLSIGHTNPGTAIVISSDANLTIGNNLSMVLANNAMAAIDGVLVVSANSKYYTNAGTTTKTVVRGTIRNNNGTILSAASMLEFTNGSVYEHAGDKGVIPAATWDRNSNCDIIGIVTTAPEGLNQIFGNYKWDCEFQTGGPQLGDAIPSKIRGNLVINKIGNSANTDTYLQIPDHVKIDGAFIFNSGNCISKGSKATIDLGGDYIMQGGHLKAAFAHADAEMTINFNGTQKQRFSKTGGSFQSINFAVLNSASVDLGESVMDGDADFIVEPGGKLMIAHPHGISTTGNSGAIQVNGKRIFSSDADYVYTGSSSQVTGTGLPAFVRRLIIDNKSGLLPGAGVKLSKPTIVQRELVLSSGFLQTTSDNILTIADAGEATAVDNSFVVGPIRKTGNTSFIFPTGWAGSNGGRIPIGISLIGTSATIQAEYKRAPATDKGATINAPLHHINYCEYWELFPVTGNPTAVITMYHNTHSSCSPVSLINDFSTVRVARSNGTAWSQVGNGDSVHTGNGYVVADSAGIIINRNERFFALGNITKANDPLPVMFDNVVAYEKNEGVNIEWSNLTERDIAIYYVERSVNGMDYTIIGQYLPKSNKDDKASYLSFDPNPAPGTNFYRIKVIEKSTKIIFSKILRIDTGLPDQTLSLYPNPVSTKQFILGLTGMMEGQYDIRIVNAIGQEICRSMIVNKGSFMAQIVKLPSSVSPGVYGLIITGSKYRETKMFIIQ